MTERRTFPIEILHKTDTASGARPGGKIRITTASFDRASDRVITAGGQLANYLQNPVVQWGHNYFDPWATIGRTISLEAGEGYMDAEFELREPATEHDPQHIVILLWEGGWVRTASIGFNPLAATANKAGGHDYTAWELLEWSLTPIPMNQEALRLAMKSVAEAAESAVVTKALSLDQQVGAVAEAVQVAIWRYIRERFDDESRYEMARYIEAIYADHAIVRIGLEFWRVDYTLDGPIVNVAASEQWVKVENFWIDMPDESSPVLMALNSRIHKAGARHSTTDQGYLNAAHDAIVAAGAQCSAAESKALPEPITKATPAPEPESPPVPDEGADVLALLATVRNLKAFLLPAGKE